MLPRRIASLYQQKHVRPVVQTTGLACVLVMLFVWNPSTTSVYPPCPFRALTGFHCAGCGSLRATHQLLHGNLGSALRLNSLMVLSIPLLGYAALATHWTRLRIPWVDRIARLPSWPQVVLVLILLYWLMRNVPFAPFCWLAPHTVSPS